MLKEWGRAYNLLGVEGFEAPMPGDEPGVALINADPTDDLTLRVRLKPLDNQDNDTYAFRPRTDSQGRRIPGTRGLEVLKYESGRPLWFVVSIDDKECWAGYEAAIGWLRKLDKPPKMESMDF